MLYDDIAARWKEPLVLVRREQPAPQPTPAPQRDASDDEYETCVHESAHAVMMMLAGEPVRFISIGERGGGLAKGMPSGLPLPRADSIAAVAACAVDLIGAIAANRFVKRAPPETDEDFRRCNSAGDAENFYRRADLLRCRDVMALRAAALRLATRCCDLHWHAIMTLAERLYEQGHLPGWIIVDILRPLPDGARLLDGVEMQMRSARYAR